MDAPEPLIELTSNDGTKEVFTQEEFWGKALYHLRWMGIHSDSVDYGIEAMFESIGWDYKYI
jgi:hypothetical protein